jgi:hypothetical protein
LPQEKKPTVDIVLFCKSLDEDTDNDEEEEEDRLLFCESS